MKSQIVGVFLILFSLHGFAGTNSSGGGHLIKAAFQRQAQELIDRIANVPAANEECPAELMRQGLRAEIRVVDRLIDPATGQPPQEANLEAWTSPGLIQLLKEPWRQKLLEPSDATVRPAVDALIAHEVYRATKALPEAQREAELCDDDRYQISGRLETLLAGPTSQERIHRFYDYVAFAGDSARRGYLLLNPETGEEYEFPTLVCDRPVDRGLQYDGPERGIPLRNCAGIEKRGGKLVYFYGKLGSESDAEGVVFRFTESRVMFESLPLPEAERAAFANLMRTTTVSRPFHLVHNSADGTVKYGTDLRQLKTLPRN